MGREDCAREEDSEIRKKVLTDERGGAIGISKSITDTITLSKQLFRTRDLTHTIRQGRFRMGS